MDFLLTSGGHNVGIVNPPPGERYVFRVSRHTPHDKYVDPDSWFARTPVHSGSWWPHWQAWLAQHSGEPIVPPALGAPNEDLVPIGDAPGEFVFAL